jgi:hypothetical protein
MFSGLEMYANFQRFLVYSNPFVVMEEEKCTYARCSYIAILSVEGRMEEIMKESIPKEVPVGCTALL